MYKNEMVCLCGRYVDCLNRATRPALGPADKAVGDIRGVAFRGKAILENAVSRNRARVVQDGGLVESADIGDAGLGDELLQAGAGGGAISAVLDHANDLILGAGVGVRTRARTIMRLHEAGVSDSEVAGQGTHAAVALLHDHGEDEALINSGRLRDALDGGLQVGALLGRVVGLAKLGTRVGDDFEVGAPHRVEAHPGALLRPAGGDVAGSKESLQIDRDAGDDPGAERRKRPKGKEPREKEPRAREPQE